MCNCTNPCSQCYSKQLIQFQVGDGQVITPESGSSNCSIPELKGCNFIIDKSGNGPLLEGIHWSRLYYGGFTLLATATFTTGETYTITIL